MEKTGVMTMKKWNLYTPEGTRDFLLEECETRHRVERVLADTFRERGYGEVMTPNVEFFDVFTSGCDPIEPEMMIKLSDTKGRLLVLRPDSTMPIMRIAATRLKNQPLPIRIFYNQPVYRMLGENNGRSNEVMQSGVELLGAKGRKADLEAIVTGIEALKAAKVNNFRMEIGHVGFFKALASGLELPSDIYEQALTLIEQKNYATLIDLFSPYGKTEEEVKALRKLPQLFGGYEIFERAKKLTRSEEALGILEYLQTIYTDLSDMGYGDHIIVDLGLVHRIEYYTGIVFRGYAEGYGETVLSGGRYDGLSSSFGIGIPAVGFAVDVDSIAAAGGNIEKSKTADVLIFSSEEDSAGAFLLMNELVRDGVLCELALVTELEDAKEYASEKGIEKVMQVGKTGKAAVTFTWVEGRWVGR